MVENGEITAEITTPSMQSKVLDGSISANLLEMTAQGGCHTLGNNPSGMTAKRGYLILNG